MSPEFQITEIKNTKYRNKRKKKKKIQFSEIYKYKLQEYGNTKKHHLNTNYRNKQKKKNKN